MKKKYTYTILGEDRNSLESLITHPKWDLDEIILSSEILVQIAQIIAYSKNKEKFLNEWQFGRFLKAGNGLTINFFGLSGTGKSITAEAVAKKLGMTIIKINYGELESELVGGTSKNLSKIFRMAEESKSLLFFDEADTVLSKRISNLSQAADYGINSAKGTLLTLLENFNGVIIFATNLFENYDSAFLRRIIFNIKFHSPDFPTRIQLWKFHLSDVIPKDASFSYEKAADLSETLCGGDIRNIAIRLGLNLLSNQEGFLNESLVATEIKHYKDLQNIHKKIDLVEKSTVESVPISNSSQLES